MTTRARRLAVVAGALLTAVAPTGCGGAARASFEATDIATGASMSPTDLDGSRVLVAVWATWCVPCARELPAIEAALPDLADAGVDVVAVNIDGPGVDPDDILAMLERLAPSLTAWRDPDSSVLAAYGGFAMPFSALLDTDGRVVQTWNGSLDPGSDEFRALVGI